MYNCSVGDAPVYPTEFLSKRVSGKSWLRSLKSINENYIVPFNKKNTFNDRSFSTISPRLLNSLPAEIQLSNSLDVIL